MLKSNRIVIPSELQNHVISLAHYRYLGTVKTNGILRTKVSFPKLDELLEKLLVECVACKVVRKNRKKHQHPA